MEKRKLLEVWDDNVRDNQIGDQEDGITPDVAKEIGYIHPADLGSVAMVSGSTIEELESFNFGRGLTLEEARRLNAAAQAKRGGKPVEDDLLR